MPRFTASKIAVLLLAGATGSVAKPPPPQASTKVLEQGLQAVARSAVARSQGQQASPLAQTVDHDQGDDHASAVAIMKVCNHDNPSAQRSAICPRPNSPP